MVIENESTIFYCSGNKGDAGDVFTTYCYFYAFIYLSISLRLFIKMKMIISVKLRALFINVLLTTPFF